MTRRIPEIGLRVALGAPPSSVMRLLLKDGLAIALVGVTAGLMAASLATPFLSTFLAGVAPRDGTSFSAVAAVLVLTALAAATARRAAGCDCPRLTRFGPTRMTISLSVSQDPYPLEELWPFHRKKRVD